jgi:hypothetical protein
MVAVPLVLAAVALAVFMLSGDEPEKRARKKEPPPPPFAFTDVESTFVSSGISIQDVPQGDQDEAAAQLTEVMNTMYDAGFVTRSRWADGTFPDVLAQFEAEASTRAQEDLAELTLGPESAQVTEVTPGESALAISVMFGADGPVGAVARASFEAEAALKEGVAMTVAHHGVYFLRPVEEGWKVVGWEVDGSLDTSQPEAGPTPTEAAS